MCIFSKPVVDVANTQIFARLCGDGSQYLSYQMKYESREKNAMILPIPTKRGASEDSVRFVNMKGYPDFFRDMRRGFPELRQFDSKVLPSRGGGLMNLQKKLKVNKVGSFVASVVPRVEDFRRLDPQFSIAPETWAKIPTYSDYSFVVFQLEELEAEVHPMAFQFDTRHEDRIFFPTVHIHDGEVHSREKFDHTLYCQHAGYDSLVGKYTNRMDQTTAFTRSNKAAGSFMKTNKSKGLIAPDLLVHKRTMKGTLTNTDVLAQGKGDPVKLSLLQNPMLQKLSLGSMLGMTSLLPLAWILNRRNRIKSTSSENESTPIR